MPDPSIDPVPLWNAYWRRLPRADEALVQHYRDIVDKTLGRYPTLQGDLRQDAESAGMQALWQAIATRQPEYSERQFLKFAWNHVPGAVLKVLDRRIKRAHLTAVSLEAIPEEVLPAAAASRALTPDMRQALTRLCPGHRLAIVRIDFLGHSVAEHARFLGWSRKRTRSLYDRAKARLKKVLAVAVLEDFQAEKIIRSEREVSDRAEVMETTSFRIDAETRRILDEAAAARPGGRGALIRDAIRVFVAPGGAQGSPRQATPSVPRRRKRKAA